MPMTWTPRGGHTLTAFKEFHLSDGSVIAVFQGSRGKNPDLDIVVKYRDRFTKTGVPRTSKHIHWVIDLLHDRRLPFGRFPLTINCGMATSL